MEQIASEIWQPDKAGSPQRRAGQQESRGAGAADFRGVRRGPRSLHRRVTSGRESLTPEETRIAKLVARGLANPDIAAKLYLSRRTVQTHVSNILAKLGMNSRLEIMREATG